ncbi:MAG: FtsQ-type POTRA domain-containing protein [Puniceicoccales bacterium]|jgi:cell division protein FtsQ|nr:FtsQ-type POTRA domain-containing protein [Puniceicoccales bacterium]
MWIFRKKSNPRVKQIVLKGQRKREVFARKVSFARGFLKFFLFFVLLSGLIYLYFVNFPRIEEYVKSIFRQPVGRIKFQTNGTLNAQWLRSFFTFQRGVDIMDVDIFAIKHRIEQCSQVKEVHVERQFPDTIKVTLQERIPILRILMREGHLHREMFVDGEGVVFSCESIAEIERQMMPFLSGTTLKRMGNGQYEKVEALEKVCELLTLAKTKYWPIYAQMEVISVEKLRKKNVPWSKINVRCHCASAVIFKDSDFDEQLKRLSFILSTQKIRNNLPVERIDLSFGKDAVINFRK